jgi:hypothetical protein
MQFCIEILQNNKYNKTMIQQHDTMHYRDSIMKYSLRPLLPVLIRMYLDTKYIQIHLY